MTRIHRIELPIPFPLKSVNCYYIPGPEPTLIDTGIDSEACLARLSERIEAAGGKVSELARIVLTHAHTDHMGMAGRLAAISGAQVFVHRWDEGKLLLGRVQWTQDRIDGFETFLAETGLPDEIVREILDDVANRFARMVSPLEAVTLLSGGETFDCGDLRFEVLHTPGHSPGSVCLYSRASRDLLSGDCLLEKITPNPVVEVRPPQQDRNYQSNTRYVASLEALKPMAVDRVLPGHGPVFGNHREVAEKIVRHQQRRGRHVLGIIEAGNGQGRHGGQTTFEVARKLFPDIAGVEMFLALSEAQGHLEVLRAQGLVELERRLGLRWYRATGTE